MRVFSQSTDGTGWKPRLRDAVRRVGGRLILGNPTHNSAGQLSMVYPDTQSRPSRRVVELAASAFSAAIREDLSSIAGRIQVGERWPAIWPGEHYKLLAGLVAVLQPLTVVEIGTYQGLGALSLAKNMPATGTVHTFDIVPCDAIAGQCLTRADLANNRIVTHVADLTMPDVVTHYADMLTRAGLIVVDAAKDGHTIVKILNQLENVRFAEPPILVIDDIRLWSMLELWQGIARPKLDVTSMGHWSGTGLVDWR